MNASLLHLIPARPRQLIYLGYGLVGFILGAIPAYCAATEAAVPGWVLGATAVYAFAGAYFGAQAAANTETVQSDVHMRVDDELEDDDPDNDLAVEPGEHRREG